MSHDVNAIPLRDPALAGSAMREAGAKKARSLSEEEEESPKGKGLRGEGVTRSLLAEMDEDESDDTEETSKGNGGAPVQA